MKNLTKEDVKFGFTFPGFSYITSEPSYTMIETLGTQAICSAVTMECCIPQPRTNLCGLMEQPEIYGLQAGQVFSFYPYPSEV